MYGLKCKYYKRTFPTLNELLDDIMISGMDPNYMITKNGKGGIKLGIEGGIWQDAKDYNTKIKNSNEAAKQLNLPITIAGPSNNKKFFDTLDESLNNYEKLTKIFDLDDMSIPYSST